MLPTLAHSFWNVAVEPVKWIPARSGWFSATAETSRPSPGSTLITPSGSPAARSRSIVNWAANCWVGLGFHSTVLPSSAGAVGRLPAIAVKLNGVIAYTKPSNGR